MISAISTTMAHIILSLLAEYYVHIGYWSQHIGKIYKWHDISNTATAL